MKISNNIFRVSISNGAGVVAALAGILVFWQTAITVFDIPSFLLPSPHDVANAMAKDHIRLTTDFFVTGAEALAGFLISTVLSLFMAIQVALHRRSEKFVLPVLVVIKSVPIVAIAPLLGFWFGYGYVGKVVVAALISFFPLVVNAISGMQDIDEVQADFFTAMKASKRDEVFLLRLPRALPNIFSAMRIAAPLAVVGAVVAEMLGARHGLGYTLAVSSMTLEISLNFAAMLLSALLGITMYYAIIAIERRTLARYRLMPKQAL